MKDILIIGAGKSSSYLIEYLIDQTEQFGNKVTVADVNLRFAEEKIKAHKNAIAIEINLNDNSSRKNIISKAFIVVSMLPADLHPIIAKDCLELKKHLFTASYISQALMEMEHDVKSNNLLFLNECGLDPGIDHMSAMKIIDNLNENGAKINSFKSYCGGLVAPESNDNPWGYKFSWNPRNVILAGQGTARYLEHNEYKYIPQHRLFNSAEKITIPDIGNFDGYANRDSLGYMKTYGLDNVSTMLRGTLRAENYCRAWDIFVQMGLNNESFEVDVKNKSYKEFSSSFIPGKGALRQRIAELCKISENDIAINMVEWTGILGEEKIPFQKASPALILQELLERKWKLQPNDKDMIVMQHIFEVEKSNTKKTILSSLKVIGESSTHTAMAKTVGLPLAIAVKLFLEGKISQRGLAIPISHEFYIPILNELEKYGIEFIETETMS
jgi:saccharopine dehydrogenase-like NADP-dependent oxidoreductase